MKYSYLRQIIKEIVEEELERGDTVKNKVEQLKNEIEKIPQLKNAYGRDESNLTPKVYLKDNPHIKRLLDNIKLDKFSFSSIFINDDMETFIPETLQLNRRGREYTRDENHRAFLFNNKHSKEYLVYCGQVEKPIYIWELIDDIAPEEEPAGAEGEEGAGADAEGAEEEDSDFGF